MRTNGQNLTWFPGFLGGCVLYARRDCALLVLLLLMLMLLLLLLLLLLLFRTNLRVGEDGCVTLKEAVIGVVVAVRPVKMCLEDDDLVTCRQSRRCMVGTVILSWLERGGGLVIYFTGTVVVAGDGEAFCRTEIQGQSFPDFIFFAFTAIGKQSEASQAQKADKLYIID